MRSVPGPGSAARVTRAQRERLNGHRGGVVYMTGLSGAGKSTLAASAERLLHDLGLHTSVIDGDDLRGGLCSDLGFSDADRIENMRRATEVARLLVDAGLVVLSAMISPFRGEREAARRRFPAGDFLEVFVDAPLAVCEARDPKGLYARARRGDLPGFTGIDSRYEPPSRPELRIDTARQTVDEGLSALLAAMHRAGFFG
ncbi:adenylyl-sulfate kinase [Piscinibacter gummiphilus]|uniref:Adenylyl-sulfate kinase n=1 Tax=Piscinibacter gummiphilus TaxID=946333 RepID=A0A1W6L6Q1_9BURK|nr:adenylyl-sulfate kinase [Piscinibacter gummiphilus]ARN19850.1 adenylyl-sulfate kinase [Piscinibacter gummiphilus]ATU64522.1 adenylyl-sulfate kinase [Piscinibacter gummiphilus]GLS95069.1 adenylyl-sulfate kinase [Piscinibacter gummiphilus]